MKGIMKNNIHSIALIAAFVLIASVSHAQTSQYQNHKKKKAAKVDAVKSQSADASKTTAAPAAGEKVDIQQIENQYWQQKDSEFHVVQSRRYTKEHRWFVSLGYSDLINDSFTRGGSFDGSVGYYFKEQHGIEFQYSHYSVTNSKTTNDIFSLGGSPAYNKLTAEYSLTYNWMPIYGKVSVMDKTIIYYDLGIKVGAGMAAYNHVLQSGDQSAQSPMFVLDITQQFFLSERWALRLDVKDRYYQDKRLNYKTQVSNSDSNIESSAMLGLIYYFGQGNNTIPSGK